MTLINPDELSAYMGNIEFTTQQIGIITSTILPGIQGELEIYLNARLEVVQVRESLMPDCHGFVTLSEAPVQSVLAARWSTEGATAIEINQYMPPAIVPEPDIERIIDKTGVAGTATSYKFNIGYSPVPSPFSFLSPTYVVIDYVAGYNPNEYDSPKMKLDLLRVSARECERMFDDLVGLRQGAVEESDQSDNRPKGWTEDEKKAWDRLRRRVVV